MKQKLPLGIQDFSDLTLDPRYGGICGITQQELEREFADEIAETVKHEGGDRMKRYAPLLPVN
jgi:hypothetical protein